MYRQLVEVLLCIIVYIQVQEDPGQLLELYRQLEEVPDVCNCLYTGT